MTQRLIDLFQRALEMEEKGKAFYEKALAECQNQVGREIFKMLRNDEFVHIKRIKRIYDSVRAGETFTDKWKQMEVEYLDLHSFFQDLAKKHGTEINADTSDLAAMDVGIDFETNAVAFYESHLPEAGGAEERAFLEKMIEEEKNHRETLIDMKFYYEDPAAWYQELEKSSLDGA